MNLATDLTGQIIGRYKSAGYEVHQGTRADVLNFGSHKYIPDFVATRGETRVAIEFNGGQIGDSHDLQIKEQAAREAGWRFDLIMTPTHNPTEPLSLAEINQTLETVVRLTRDYRDPRTSILVGWSAMEAILRQACLQAGIQMDGRSPQDVLKQSVSLGFLEETDFQFLLSALRARDAAAHGTKMPPDSEQLVEPLIKLAQALSVRLRSGYISEE
jgi:hypothetical protein